jgi:hypothetical protein
VLSQQAERHHRRELWLLEAEDLFEDVKLIDELADPAVRPSHTAPPTLW